MSTTILLASGSEIRAQLLQNAGLTIEVKPQKVDEEATKAALLAQEVSHRDISDALAELKARRGSLSDPDKIIIGADQVLSCNGELFDKSKSKIDLKEQLNRLSGQVHTLFSATVIYHQNQPQWRYIGQAQMMMRVLSSEFIDSYVDDNWDTIQHCVGGYQLEGVGAQLFTRVQGDYFSVLGLPLLEILGYFRTQGVLRL